MYFDIFHFAVRQFFPDKSMCSHLSDVLINNRVKEARSVWVRAVFNKLKLNSFINGVNFILSDTQVYHCDIQTGMLEDTA